VEKGRVSPGAFARSFLNDCLIAASARDEGFTLVTRNLRDFDLVSEVEPGFRFVEPWPER
jgi:predicted nucleic acid-binding protein